MIYSLRSIFACHNDDKDLVYVLKDITQKTHIERTHKDETLKDVTVLKRHTTGKPSTNDTQTNVFCAKLGVLYPLHSHPHLHNEVSPTRQVVHRTRISLCDAGIIGIRRSEATPVTSSPTLTRRRMRDTGGM